MSRGDEEFEIKTESIAIKEEWKTDLILPNVRNENEEINDHFAPPEDFNMSDIAPVAKKASRPNTKFTYPKTTVNKVESQIDLNQANIKKENEIYHDETKVSLAPEELNFVKCEPQEDLIDTQDNMKKDPLELQKKYNCNVCKKSYLRKYALSRHIKTVHDGKRFECKNCNRSFTNPRSLKAHQLAVHEGKVFECDICNQIYVLPKSLREHRSVVHNGKKYECETCNQIFTRSANLKRHELAVHGLGKKFECKICNQIFTLSRELKTHQMADHVGKKFCDICDKSFSSKTVLLDHIKTVHDGKRYCKIYDKTFTLSSSLKKHQLVVHEEIKKYQCEACNKSFSNPNHLKSHQLVVHEGKKYDTYYLKDPEKTEQNSKESMTPGAELGGSNYKWISRLNTNSQELLLQCFDQEAHRKKQNFLENRVIKQSTETTTDQNNSSITNSFNQKDWICQAFGDDCSLNFKSEAALRRHIKDDHYQPKEKCDKTGCDFSTYTQELLAKHKKTQHKDWICQAYDCGEKFSTEELLMEHIKTDHQVKKDIKKKYECEICNKSFIQPGYLEAHQSLVHEGIKKYECKTCKKPFVNKSNLNKHIKKVHEERNTM